MKFHRVIGKIDQKIIDEATELLSKVFLDLVLRSDNEHIGSSLGGDPLIFSLIYPMQHIATMNIPTAATDGRRYYWNPKFVLSKSRIGLRIVCAHEAWHAIYMHPQRRGSRLPKLWNIAVDYMVNYTIMQDLKLRKIDPSATFKKELGNFLNLEGYVAHIANPFAPIKGIEDFIPEPEEIGAEVVKLPHADDDRELTDKEKEEFAKIKKKFKYFYADPDLPDNLRKPEKIYDYLYNLLPKCPKCGKVGMYKFPDLPEEEIKIPSKKKNPKEADKYAVDNESDLYEHDHSHDDSAGDSPANDTCVPPTPGPGKGCDHCGGGYDIFGSGGTLDDHMDSSESQDKMAKRLADAIENAKKMAGAIPASLEDELGLLLAPKIKWQDFLRAKLLKTRAGNSKNDWTSFRSRPLFAGLLIPKKINNFATFGCLLDTSGSMSKEDMTFGVSQLQSIDERSEGWIVPADAEIYWADHTKLKRANSENITKIKVKGRGGTKYAEFFRDYENKIGKVDFIIMITDGFLDEKDISEMVHPGIDVVWLITSESTFNAPFGRVFGLRS